MGEGKKALTRPRKDLVEKDGLQVADGRVQVRWETDSATTPMAQLAYFVEYLILTGLWTRWLESCPLQYQSPNAPSRADVLGTWMLSILSGHRRYAHVTAIRGDGVTPGLLGMSKVVSEDSLRRAIKAIPEESGVSWLDTQLKDSVRPLLDIPWVLDIDTTVKPLYGHQEGAVVSYNPKKPGRPSHSYHTYIIAGLRLVIGAEVKAGNENSGKHTLPGLLKILDELEPAKKPNLVRGDCGFGSTSIMTELEIRNQSYLFKLRLSRNVKRLIEELFWSSDWQDAGQGWEGKDEKLQLSGWEKSRRVVVLRRPIKGEIVVSQDSAAQNWLGFVELNRKDGKKVTGYEYAVLVTNLDYGIQSLAQLYRDRADAENVFDELKNQWGWGGYTTKDLHRCQLTSRTVALVYNWWSLFVRLAHPSQRKEAITSRPWLMSAIGKKTEHSGQTTITINGIHAHADKARRALRKVSTLLNVWTAQAAEQFTQLTVWHRLCDYLKHILTGFSPPEPPLALES